LKYFAGRRDLNPELTNALSGNRGKTPDSTTWVSVNLAARGNPDRWRGCRLASCRRGLPENVRGLDICDSIRVPCESKAGSRVLAGTTGFEPELATGREWQRAVTV
jgi:hypothetical protein